MDRQSGSLRVSGPVRRCATGKSLVDAEQPAWCLTVKTATEQRKSLDRVWPRNHSCWIRAP